MQRAPCSGVWPYALMYAWELCLGVSSTSRGGGQVLFQHDYHINGAHFVRALLTYDDNVTTPTSALDATIMSDCALVDSRLTYNVYRYILVFITHDTPAVVQPATLPAPPIYGRALPLATAVPPIVLLHSGNTTSL